MKAMLRNWGQDSSKACGTILVFCLDQKQAAMCVSSSYSCHTFFGGETLPVQIYLFFDHLKHLPKLNRHLCL